MSSAHRFIGLVPLLTLAGCSFFHYSAPRHDAQGHLQCPSDTSTALIDTVVATAALVAVIGGLVDFTANSHQGDFIPVGGYFVIGGGVFLLPFGPGAIYGWSKRSACSDAMASR